MHEERKETSRKKRVPVQNRKKMAVQTALLRALYVGGLISMVVVAPKTAALLKHLDRGKKHRAELYARINRAKANLKHRGFVDEDGKGRLRLTEKGEAGIEKVLMREYVIPEQVMWDGKWRILMFDIRETRRRVREQLRRLLTGAGFVLLQDSVWVYPYPCDEFVALVRAHLKSGVGELRVVTADALESDRALRDHFRLS